MNAFITFFTSFLAEHVSRDWVPAIISLLPILELRGGLLAASLLQVSFRYAVLSCIAANLLPIPFVLLFMEKILLLLERNAATKGIAGFFRSKVDKNRAGIDKYGTLGLILFVGIPLPGTGAWTGAVVASLLHLNRRNAFLCILLGVLLAAVIMSVVSYGMLGSILH